MLSSNRIFVDVGTEVANVVSLSLSGKEPNGVEEEKYGGRAGYLY
jgi:hypothetical protein